MKRIGSWQDKNIFRTESEFPFMCDTLARGPTQQTQSPVEHPVLAHVCVCTWRLESRDMSTVYRKDLLNQAFLQDGISTVYFDQSSVRTWVSSFVRKSLMIYYISQTRMVQVTVNPRSCNYTYGTDRYLDPTQKHRYSTLVVGFQPRPSKVQNIIPQPAIRCALSYEQLFPILC